MILSKKTVDRGYTINADSDKIKFGIKGGSLADAVKFFLFTIGQKEIKALPKNKILMSDIYEYSFNSGSEKAKIIIPITVSISHGLSESEKYLYSYDSTTKKWSEILGTVDTGSRFSFKTSAAHGILAVVGDNDSFCGKATWYRDRSEPNGAATNLFPLGSKIKVTNLDNKKSVEVEIVSTWKGRKGYVIDLVSAAFKRIAPLGQGSANVKIEKIK